MPNKYKLLDTGDGKKLEQIGQHTIIRSAAQAIWSKQNETIWEDAESEFVNIQSETGKWMPSKELAAKIGKKRSQIGTNLEELWTIENERGSIYNISPNSYGNIGIFPEHWSYYDKLTELFDVNDQILNLFTYSGTSCIDLAVAGYKITAVDSSKSAMNLYTSNLEANKVDRKGHKLVLEDVMKYVKREVRRGSKYKSIMVDMPSFGRGTKGEVFNIDDDFSILIKEIKNLMDIDSKLVVTQHSPRFTISMIEYYFAKEFPGKNVQASEIVLTAESGAILPSGMIIEVV